MRSEEGESEEGMSWRGAGQSSVRAAFEADLRVGTPLVRRHRAISGSTETGPQTRGARSRRRRAGTRGSFTHPKAPRPRASAATGPAPCRLASRPSEVAAVGTSDEAQLRLLVSNVLRRRFDFGIFLHVALSQTSRELLAWRVSGGATQQPLAAVRGRDASPLERRGGGVRQGGAPPGVESGEEHRHARRAVRSHLLRSRAIPRPAKRSPLQSRRPRTTRETRQPRGTRGGRLALPSSPRVSSRFLARLSRPRTAGAPAATLTRRPTSRNTSEPATVVFFRRLSTHTPPSRARSVCRIESLRFALRRLRRFKIETTQRVPHDRRLGARHRSRRGRVPG